MDLNEKLIEIREKLYNMSISEFEEMLERNGADRYMSNEINGRTDINAPFRPKVLATEEEMKEILTTKSYLDCFHNNHTIEDCFSSIEQYCKEHKGESGKIYCYDNGCIFCKEEEGLMGIMYHCRLKDMTW